MLSGRSELLADASARIARRRSRSDPRSSSWINVVTASGIDIPASRATASGKDPPERAFHTLRSLVVEVGGAGGGAVAIDAEVVEEVTRTSDERRPVTDHLERRLRERARHGPRDGEDLPSEVERVIDGDPRPALRRALHHHQRTRERHDDPVPCGEVLRPRRNAGRVLAHDRAGLGDRVRAVLGCSPGRRRRSRSRAPRPFGPPAWSAPRCAAASIPCAAPETTARPARHERPPQVLRDVPPEVRALPRADDRDTARASHASGSPEQEEARRRIPEVEQPVVVLGIRRRDEPRPGLLDAELRSARGRSAAATRGPRRFPAGRAERTRRIRVAVPCLPRFRVHLERAQALAAPTASGARAVRRRPSPNPGGHPCGDGGSGSSGTREHLRPEAASV